MHILHIISTLDPAKGGPAEGVRLLLSQQDAGWSGEVATLDDPAAPYLQDLPFKVHALGTVKSVYAYSPALLPWLRANRKRFDGFLLNGLWQYCGLATMLAAGSSIPYLVYAHGMLDPYFKQRFPAKHLKKILYWYPVEFWVLRRAFRTLFTTTTEEHLARKSFAFWSWRAAVVPYGIEPPSTDVTTNTEAFFDCVPSLRGKRFLTFLGRIHPKKGCDLLVKAFCETAQRDPDVHLLMAGPDPDGWSEELKQIAADHGVADRIHWPGILRGPAKWGAFQAAEAFILTSHQENFGIAAAEALACGRPVLLSEPVNLAATLQQAGCAFVEPDTAEGARNLLLRWLALTAPERGMMNAKATACFRASFNLRENVEAIQGIFRQAHESGRYRKGRAAR